MKKGDPRGSPLSFVNAVAAHAAVHHQNVYLPASVTLRPIWLW